MAFLLNPNYGTEPGAPHGLNWWQGPQFMISDLLASAPPPPPPLAPTLTSQDATPAFTVDPGNAGATGDAGSYGGDGAGQPGTLGGLGQPDPYAQGMNPYAGSGPLGNLVTGWGSTFNNPATYTPAQFDSRYGLLGGTLGMTAGTLAGVPGLGTGLGTIGEVIDLGRYVDNLRAAGISIDPNYLSAALAGASSLPFGIGNLFGTSARAQSENARRDALAEGVVVGNVDPAILDRSAAAPAPFDPTYGGSFDLSYGYGAAPGGEGTMAAPQGQTGYASGVYGSGIGVDPNAGGVGPSADQGGSDPNARGGDFGFADRFGWSTGGAIGAPLSRGPARPGLPIDPPGPDDTMIPAQVGEGVLTRKAMQTYPGLLDAANSGRLDPAKVGGLLSAKPPRRGRR